MKILTIAKNNKLIIFVIMFCLFLVYLYFQNNWIEVTNYSIEISSLPKELDGLKIAHLSDVHLPKNASSINGLVSTVQNQHPDLILITGDIIDSSADISNCGLSQLAKELSKVSPTFAVTGNHEYWNGNVPLWKKILEENNVLILENKSIEINIKGTKLTLIGIEDEQPLSIMPHKNKTYPNPVILLAHRPERWQTYTSFNNLKPDLVLTGHAHGGQFRIPFLGGLISPNQGFFPKFTSGLYSLNNTSKMIVSRGLGNSIIPFRFNNRPHLPIITFTKNR